MNDHIQKPPENENRVGQYIYQVWRSINIPELDRINIYSLLTEVSWSKENQLYKYEHILNKYANEALVVALLSNSTLPTIDFILAHGADPNFEFYSFAPLYYTCTPLILAVFLNNIQLVNLLLMYNADVNYVIVDHARALTPELREYLLETGNTALQTAIKFENLSMIKKLIHHYGAIIRLSDITKTDDMSIREYLEKEMNKQQILTSFTAQLYRDSRSNHKRLKTNKDSVRTLKKFLGFSKKKNRLTKHK